MPKGESNSGNRNRAASHLPVLVDPRLVKALSHVVRQHVLLAAVAGEVSPKGLSEALDEDLGQVSYHVKVLRDECDGLLKVTRTKQRRGAVEHYYRATARSLFPAKAWRRLEKGLRAVVGAGQANDLFNDLADALKAGKLQGEHDHIARTPLILDSEGERNVKAIAERATKEVESEQRAVAKRLKKANGDGGNATGYTFALLAFEAAWEPADLHVLAAQAEKVASASVNGANGAGRNSSESKRAKRKVGSARR